MRITKVWMCATLFAAVLAYAVLTQSGSATAAADPKAAVANHWQHHDGHWNYWNDADQRWYYTDGTNWFYNNGTAWNVYGFDKQFGREGFEKGEYKVPESGAKIETPRHAYYHPPGK